MLKENKLLNSEVLKFGIKFLKYFAKALKSLEGFIKESEFGNMSKLAKTYKQQPIKTKFSLAKASFK